MNLKKKNKNFFSYLCKFVFNFLVGYTQKLFEIFLIIQQKLKTKKSRDIRRSLTWQAFNVLSLFHFLKIFGKVMLFCFYNTKKTNILLNSTLYEIWTLTDFGH